MLQEKVEILKYIGTWRNIVDTLKIVLYFEAHENTINVAFKKN